MPIQIDNSNNFTVTLAAPTSGSTTLTFPSNAGASTNGLITNGSGVLSWGVIPVGTIVGVTGTANTTGTNLTRAVDALSVAVAGSSTDQALALVPKGNGSLVLTGSAGVATNYGTYNVCFQYQGADGGRVAQGTNNVILGGNSTAIGNTDSSSAYNVAIANENDCRINRTGNVVVGCYGMYVTGNYNTVYGAINSSGLARVLNTDYCTITPGRNPRTDFNYQHVMSGNGYDPNSNGNASRYFLFHLLGTTNSTTPVQLFTNDSSGSPSTINDNFSFQTGNNCVAGFWGYVIACTQLGAAAYAWEFFYGVKNNGASSAGFTGAGSVTALGGDASLAGCTVAVTTDLTNNAVAFTVTGLAATNIRWVAQVQCIRMGGF